MSTIRHSSYVVDVADADCGARSCFRLGFDKGSFTPGVGYTRYHSVARPVCMERHLNGCPHRDDAWDAKCGDCGKIIARISDPDGLPANCPHCESTDTYRLAVLPDPTPCCDAPNVPHNPTARKQTCRSCKTPLTGLRLEHARRVFG